LPSIDRLTRGEYRAYIDHCIMSEKITVFKELRTETSEDLYLITEHPNFVKTVGCWFRLSDDVFEGNLQNIYERWK
jgi:hypothetical protein